MKLIEGHTLVRTAHSKYESSEELEKELQKVIYEAKEKSRVVILTDLGNMRFYGENVAYFEVEIYEKDQR